MGDNNITYVGETIVLVDPNKFDNQYNGTTDRELFNMSVPTEDLCISVELETESKGRTLLSSDSSGYQVTNTGNKVVVKFIDGPGLSNDGLVRNSPSTANKNYLTTEYTNLSTQLEPIGEALGITNIEIEFSSSYTPMITINFVDVKGGAIFQNAATSKYGVFFQLPYPLFKLTVKGYYGKPVTYCLHMIKCNSKFNSQTGNFEITAQFVGFTYAMFSDMLIGYLKAAEETTTGAARLQSLGVKSLTDFYIEISKIDKEIGKELLSPDNEDTANLSIIKSLRLILDDMSTIMGGAIGDINADTKNPKAFDSKDSKMVFIKLNNDLAGNPINDSENDIIVSDFRGRIEEKITLFNSEANNIKDIAITNKFFVYNLLYPNLNSFKIGDHTTIISNKTGISSTDTKAISNVYQSIITAIGNNSGDYPFSVYDFNPLNDIIEKQKILLNDIEDNLRKDIANQINKKISDKLGFDTSIRSIFRLFTTSVEIFLDQLAEVSNKAFNNPDRDKQLSKLKNGNSLDIKIDSKTIYPWPEYSENDVEKYLGAEGVLTTPLDVPEIKFVEDLFTAFKRIEKKEADVEKTLAQGTSSWYAINPLDSAYYNTNYTNPYDRLPATLPVDVARIILLRAIAFLGFSNNVNSLTNEEIQTFATEEVKNVVDKYQLDSNNIINILAVNYATVDKFLGITGKIDMSDKSLTISNNINIPDKLILVNNSTSGLTYNYVDYVVSTGYGDRQVLPITGNFTDITLGYVESSSTTHLSNVIGGLDKNETEIDATTSYLDFITKDEYEKQITQPSGVKPSQFTLSKLSTELKIPSDFKDAGFLANSGIYGVQEFRKIDIDDPKYGVDPTKKITDLYTIFFDDNSIALTRPRKYENKTTETNFWDVSNTIKLPNYAKDNNVLINPSDIPRDDMCNNVKLICELNSNQNTNNISYPYLTFSTSYIAGTTSYSVGLSPETAYLSSDKQKRFKSLDLSLFGSRFYNIQTSNESKALLFLHTLPWKGLTNDVNGWGIFNRNEIINLFKNRTGFVQVPKLFTVFIGGLLWRLKQTSEPIVFKSSDNKTVMFGDIPKQTQYLRVKDSTLKSAMSFGNANDYIDLDPIFNSLPKTVKDKFILEFTTFVEKEFGKYQSLLEIKPTGGSTDADWVKSWDAINNTTTRTVATTQPTVYGTVKLTDIEKNIKPANGDSFSKNYNIFSFLSKYNNDDASAIVTSGYEYNYFMEYKDTGEISRFLINNIFGVSNYKYISNQSWMIWTDLPDKHYRVEFDKEKILTVYLNEIIKGLTDKHKLIQDNKLGNNSDDIFKFEMYRTLKKIYDKWITNTTNSTDNGSNPNLFQCCTANKNFRLTADTQQMLHRKEELGQRSDTSSPRLIDSFRFINRAFKDIGDIFQINPIIVSQMLKDSTNTNVYDMFSRILTDNHFDFVPLPSYVNYNDPQEVKNMFTPYSYLESKVEAATGPSFVCVYVGQTSTKLDFGKNSEYPNDGFDFNNDCLNCPDDIKSSKREKWEDIGVAFMVNYGQQNQNIFQDIILDQNEFGETSESLQMMDHIANMGSNVKKSFVGQNLYNVFSSRSYKTEIQMLGNAMIQPMMYFQLNNIPMFRGAYLITKVKHSIKPNHMTTTFNGTRIKIAKTPLIDVETLYSSILDNFKLPEVNSSSKLSSNVVSSISNTGTYPPIVITIQSNGATNGNINVNNIKLLPVPQIKGVYNEKLSDANPDKRCLITEATNALVLMLNAFVEYAKSKNYKTLNGNYISITSLFRDITTQIELKKQYGQQAAIPGRSNHGWGIAVDFQFIKNIEPNASGTLEYIHNSVNDSSGFDVAVNPSLKWFLDNSYYYGFFMPNNLRDGVGIEEFWHFEYHGTSAPCLWKKYPKVHSNTVTIPSDKQANILNPKGSDGKVATYPTCDYVVVKEADGTHDTYVGYVAKNIKQTDTIKNVYVPALNTALPDVSNGVKLLLQAQTQNEGFIPPNASYPNGSLSYRTNNPGNVGNTGKKIKKFDQLSEGVKAQWNQVLGPTFNNTSSQYKPSFTLYQYLSKYAPIYDDNGKRTDNNPTDYANFVINYFKTVGGITIDSTTTLNQIKGIT